MSTPAVRENMTPALQTLVQRVREDDFIEQIRPLLPANITPEKFVGATVAALLQNPDIAKADQTSIVQSIIRSAQDGLLPDGREAAIVVFGGKAQYMPMVGGFRKIAAEHGWVINTNVVCANDEFEFTGSPVPPTFTHRPVRPGATRGDLIAAVAVATHRDGRRIEKVLYAEEVEKRRKTARSKNVWDSWTAQMWEKTAAREVFGEIPLDPSDVRINRLIEASQFESGEAATLLYGPAATERPSFGVLPSGPVATVPAEVDEVVPAGDDGSQQAEPEVPIPASGSAPGNDNDFGGSAESTEEDEIAAAAESAGAFVVSLANADNWAHGLTLAQIAEQDGDRPSLFFGWAMRENEPAELVWSAFAYARVHFPELYAAATAAKQAA